VDSNTSFLAPSPAAAPGRSQQEEARHRLGTAGAPRILIIRAGAIGDTLMVTPLLRAVRRTFPDAYLAFLCSRGSQDVLRHNPHLNQLLPLGYRNLPYWLSREKIQTTRRLRELNFDWSICLETHPRFLDLAGRANAKRSIAYANPWTPDRFEHVPFDPSVHCIENHLRAARGFGVQPDGLEMELHYASEWDENLQRRLRSAGIGGNDCVVGVHAGWGGRKHPPDQTRLRSWPAANFAEVVRWLAQSVGARVVLTGSAPDHLINENIRRLSAVDSLNLAGKMSLLETAALIRRLNLYLTVDSGPAHMAAALGTPLVTLWGPGILVQTAPLAGRGPVRILNRHVHCAPCYGTPLMKSCQDNICMKQIRVADVEEALQQTLGLTRAED
jgi:heptosyltransferase II